VGRFSVEFEVANNDDLALARRGLLPKKQVRRQTISGVVDPGAVTLVLPQAVVKQLGLPLGDRIKVRYADGRRARRKGRMSNSSAVIALFRPSSSRNAKRL
jgi:hypothetical protein